MDQFIQKVVGELGVADDTARSATGGLLNLVKDNVDGGTFSELLGALPGADGLMGSASSDGGGGLLSGALGGIGSSLGGNVGGAAKLLSVLQGAGLSTEQAGSFVGMLIEYVKSQGGSELVEKVLAGLPQLRSLAG